MSKLTKSQKLAKRLAQRKYRAEHPVKYRNMWKNSARKYRESHKEENREYMSNYFKEWRSDPINAKCHWTRCLVGYMRRQNLKGASSKYDWIADNLYQVGWSENMDKSLCINHICSLHYLFSFCINLPLEIVYNVNNIEVVTKIENNKAKNRTVTERTLRAARKLEKKYPIDLKGFEEYLTKYKGDIK